MQALAVLLNQIPVNSPKGDGEADKICNLNNTSSFWKQPGFSIYSTYEAQRSDFKPFVMQLNRISDQIFHINKIHQIANMKKLLLIFVFLALLSIGFTKISPFQSALSNFPFTSTQTVNFYVVHDQPTTVQNKAVDQNKYRLVFRPYPGTYSSVITSKPFDPFGTGRHTDYMLNLSAYSRSSNGYMNNENHPTYGMSESMLSRATKSLYQDSKEKPMDSNYSPRIISNQLGRVSYPLTLNPNNVTMAFTIWGQFIDHDLSLTQVNSEETMNIQIPKCDIFLDLECKGDKNIPFKRSLYDHNQASREQMNSITSWIDGSQVYGSTDAVAKRLRSFQNGKLKTGQKNMLPSQEGNNPYGMPEAGDIRAAQNLVLLSYHNIFMREHNRLCDIILQKQKNLSDQNVYQIAKNYVTALIQKITFEDFLPTLLGTKAYGKLIGYYRGYDYNANPTIENEFSAAAFRFGHSLLVDKYRLVDKDGVKVGEIKLNDMFFKPTDLSSDKIDLILRGLSETIAKKRDGTVIDEVRNLLIGDPAQRHINLDLYALNIQRARDHGLEKYNYLRKVYGLRSLTNFSELTKDASRVKLLSTYYNDDINKLDAWVGILNEDSLEGAVIGELGATIIGKQFRNLRDGDRFWYERVLDQSTKAEIKGTFFSEIIIRNTKIMELGEDIFHYDPELRKMKY